MHWFLPFMQHAIMRRTEGKPVCLVAALLLALVPSTFGGRSVLKDGTSAPETPRGGTGGVMVVKTNTGLDISLANILSTQVGAGNTWSQAYWTDSSDDKDPAARAIFGAHLNDDEVIHLRGNP